MAATRTWNELTPADSDNINQGAAKIREHKEDIRERFEVDHIMNVGVSTDGFHNKTQLANQGSRPTTASGYSIIWAENSGGVSQPYMKDGSGNVRQLGVPVGAIMAYLPGYFTAVGNVGYTGVSMTLPDGWVLCDGAAPNDANSPIWNTSARRVPDLDDSRFLCGSTAGNRGTAAGSNTLTAHTATYPNHTHTFTQPSAHVITIANHSISAHSITQPAFDMPAHNHKWIDNYVTGDSGPPFNYPYYTQGSYNSAGVLGSLSNKSTSPPCTNSRNINFDSSETKIPYPTGSADYDCYTSNTAGTENCTRVTNVAVGNHSALSHTVSSITNNHSGGAVTSSGGGSVTISSNHSSNDNMPQYLMVSYIIKIK